MKNQKIPVVLGLLPLMGLSGCGMLGGGEERRPEITHATRLNVAMAAEASGDSQTALQLYATAVAKNPSDTNAVVLYARALVNARRISLARELLVRQLEAQPRQAALARELGTIDVLQGQPAAALPRFDMALSRDPDDVRALVNKAIALDMLGNHAEAQQIYARADRLSPDDATIRSNLAMSLMLAGRAADATRMMETVSEGPVAVPRIRNNMAVLAASSGDMARARQLSNGDISEAELRTLVEQIRQREAVAPAPVAAAPTAPIAAAPIAAEPTATQTVAAPAVAAPPVSMQPIVASPDTQATGAPLPLAVPDNGRRPAGEKLTPTRVAPAKPAPVDRRNMTSLDRQIAQNIERAAERELVDSIIAPAMANVAVANTTPVASRAANRPTVIEAMAISPLRVRMANMGTEDAGSAVLSGLRLAPTSGTRGLRLGYGVQLGALDSANLAQFVWRRLSVQMPGLLEGRESHIVHMIRSDDGRNFWRLVTTGFQDRSAASDLCAEIKAQGTDCFVTKI